MGLDAEFLLLATGLLETPKPEHIRAARTYPAELEVALAAALERETPGFLLVIPDRKTYYDRLVKTDPDYAAVQVYVGAKLGPDEATAYQLAQQKAVATMKQHRPHAEVHTLVGPLDAPNPYDKDLRYSWEIEVVENHLRLAKDLAAAAVLPSNVALFATLYPAVYKFAYNSLRRSMSAKKARDPDWFPALWLDGAARVFWQEPWDSVIDVTGPGALGAVKVRPTQVQTVSQGLTEKGRTPPASR
jgi:hypothetical protein